MAKIKNTLLGVFLVVGY